MIITELQINDTVEQQLHLVASRQIPFAVAASLTAVTKIAQAEVRDHINETFTIRRKSGGFASSIAVKPATKQSLTAEVYTMARFAALQQIGGLRQPQGSNLAIPSYQNLSEVKMRRSARSIADAFEMKLQDGQMALVRRKGKSLQFLYFLRKQADVTKRFKMIEIVTETARREFARTLEAKIREL